MGVRLTIWVSNCEILRSACILEQWRGLAENHSSALDRQPEIRMSKNDHYHFQQTSNSVRLGRSRRTCVHAFQYRPIPIFLFLHRRLHPHIVSASSYLACWSKLRRSLDLPAFKSSRGRKELSNFDAIDLSTLYPTPKSLLTTVDNTFQIAQDH